MTEYQFGPFKYERSELNKLPGYHIRAVEDNDYVGTVLLETEARLFVAAPDLLAALKEALPALGWTVYSDAELQHELSMGNGRAATVLQVRAAIAKAIG